MSAVSLCVYDLSAGMARAISAGQLEAIYHTSVVVFGLEVFFGAGVQACVPGQSGHGHAIERIPMGSTSVSRADFDAQIAAMSRTWTAESYHLLDNNCNNFTEALCRFLVGRGIPERITQLPANFLATPLGQQLLPLITSFFGPSRAVPAIREPSPLPPVPHGASTKPATPAIDRIGSKPILFSVPAKMAPLTTKLLSFLESSKESHDSEVIDALCGDKQPRSKLEARHVAWIESTYKRRLAPGQLFPLIDLARICITDPAVSPQFTDAMATAAPNLLSYNDASTADADMLMMVRFACHAIAIDALSKTLASPSGGRPQVTNILVNSLLATLPGIRQAGASLAFNVACKLSLISDTADEEWLTECLSAITTAFAKEDNEQTAFRLLCAMALMLKHSPSVDLRELLNALEFPDAIDSKAQIWTNATSGASVGNEIKTMLML